MSTIRARLFYGKAALPSFGTQSHPTIWFALASFSSSRLKKLLIVIQRHQIPHRSHPLLLLLLSRLELPRHSVSIRLDQVTMLGAKSQGSLLTHHLFDKSTISSVNYTEQILSPRIRGTPFSILFVVGEKRILKRVLEGTWIFKRPTGSRVLGKAYLPNEKGTAAFRSGHRILNVHYNVRFPLHGVKIYDGYYNHLNECESLQRV
jgi:hypothetical protein